MELPDNIKTFLKGTRASNINGEGVVCLIVYFLAGGQKSVEILVGDIKKSWSKTIIGKSYNTVYTTRAYGRIDRKSKGKVYLTDEGVAYVEDTLNIEKRSSDLSHLVIFDKKTAHSFDKFVREVLQKATSTVDIADTYVSSKLFDHLLDEVRPGVKIRFLYTTDSDTFVTRSTRFSAQYDFKIKQSSQFHDRFLVVDGKGYIIGPSLKDAADKKPATVVVLSETDSRKLAQLFSKLW